MQHRLGDRRSARTDPPKSERSSKKCYSAPAQVRTLTEQNSTKTLNPHKPLKPLHRRHI
jgi:hypothetical protein